MRKSVRRQCKMEVMTMKKIFALLFSLLLCVSVLAGCGSDKKAESGKQSGVTTSVQEKKPVAQVNASGNSAKLKVDFDGEYTDKVRVAAYINQFRARRPIISPRTRPRAGLADKGNAG